MVLDSSATALGTKVQTFCFLLQSFDAEAYLEAVKADVQEPCPEQTSESNTGNPTATTTGNPTATTTGNPTATTMGNPTATTMGNLAATTMGNPTATTMGNLAATTMGNPTATTMGNPTATTMGNPTATTTGYPVATTTGNPAAAATTTVNLAPASSNPSAGASSLSDPLHGVFDFSVQGNSMLHLSVQANMLGSSTLDHNTEVNNDNVPDEVPVCGYTRPNLTRTSEVFQEMLENISEYIRVDTQNTSQSRRKKESAQDQRVSSVSVGILSCCLIGVVLGMIILTDLIRLIMHVTGEGGLEKV